MSIEPYPDPGVAMVAEVEAEGVDPYPDPVVYESTGAPFS